MGVACNPLLVPVMIKLAEELCVPIPERDWMNTIDVWEAYDGDVSYNVEKFVNMLDKLNPGTYRIVLHPTIDNAESRAIDSYFGVKGARAGQNDLNMLLSKEVKAAIKRNGIELISISDLWDYEKCQIRTPVINKRKELKINKLKRPPTMAIIQRGFYSILKIYIFNQLDFSAE